MKIVHLDIESKPHTAYVWSLFKQNIGINQLVDTGGVMCFSYKWHKDPKVHFVSEWGDGHEEMIRHAHRVLSEADAITTYNGDKFDLPMLKKEFLLYKLGPHIPCHSIDIYRTVRGQFKFASNKLDHIAQEMGVGAKVRHPGMELWVECMGGVEKAQRLMERYNKQDVKLLEKVYKRVLPYIKNHPNHALYIDDDRPVCPNCGSHHVKKNGVEPLATQTYQRYKCTDCGTNIRGRTTVLPKEKRKAILTQSKL
jgi:DNA polymerase elongation subunit (family B)/DNA-directed RNA polymerase subunit RPC12/RpoP